MPFSNFPSIYPGKQREQRGVKTATCYQVLSHISGAVTRQRGSEASGSPHQTSERHEFKTGTGVTVKSGFRAGLPGSPQRGC